MDALRLMLLSLMIGASVSSGPADVPASVAPQAAVSQALDPATIFQQQLEARGVTAAPSSTAIPTPSPTIALITVGPSATPQASAKASGGGSATKSSSSLPRQLRKGSEGDDVRMLQQLLKDLGYSLSVDGTFGTRTRDAVKAFQSNNGLKADGIAGTRTIRKLTGGDAKGAGSASDERTTLSYGMSGQDVSDLQAQLSALGYYSEVVTGNYLSKTKDAVKWFQEVNGLKVDGIAGPATLSLVYSGTAIPVDDGAGVTIAPSGFTRTLREGMSGDDVSLLQRLLKDLWYFNASVTGYFGPTTKHAVTLFQTYNGLHADGVAGSETQLLLTSGRAIAFTSGVGSASPGAPTDQYMLCGQCGEFYTSAESNLHSKNASCDHLLCMGTHRACLYCGQPECSPPDQCGSNLNPSYPSCVY